MRRRTEPAPRGSRSSQAASTPTHRAAAGLSRSPAGAGLTFQSQPVQAPSAPWGHPPLQDPQARGHREMRPRLSPPKHPRFSGRGAQAQILTVLDPSPARRATRTRAKRVPERATTPDRPPQSSPVRAHRCRPAPWPRSEC